MAKREKSAAFVDHPPSRSRNVITDAWHFLFSKPPVNTLIRFETEQMRAEYNGRIRQRVGIDINKNTVLNVHQIGIDAPVSLVFNELLNWNGDSTCWPNHVAKIERVDDNIEEIRVLPFGWKEYPFRFMKSIFGMQLKPLFNLNSIRIKSVPDSFDFDNARYLLYSSSGGYPIGIFAMYVRSAIAELNEIAPSQLFFVVSFNFYGKEKQANKFINRAWESVHNRVTSNVLNRIKQLSEWRIAKLEKSGIPGQ